VSGSAARVFDIVNGFLNRCRGGIVFAITVALAMSSQDQIKLIIWLRYSSIPMVRKDFGAAIMQGCR
jgi:hypothetical protein